jgi:hypothetical protein
LEPVKKVSIMISRKRYEEILDEISSHDGYCFLKELLKLQRSDPRMLIQMKCIEIHKWVISENFEYEYSWEEAGNDWVERGYAAVFADLYNEDETPKRLYNKIEKKIDNPE